MVAPSGRFLTPTYPYPTSLFIPYARIIDLQVVVIEIERHFCYMVALVYGCLHSKNKPKNNEVGVLKLIKLWYSKIYCLKTSDKLVDCGYTVFDYRDASLFGFVSRLNTMKVTYPTWNSTPTWSMEA